MARARFGSVALGGGEQRARACPQRVGGGRQLDWPFAGHALARSLASTHLTYRYFAAARARALDRPVVIVLGVAAVVRRLLHVARAARTT